MLEKKLTDLVRYTIADSILSHADTSPHSLPGLSFGTLPNPALLARPLCCASNYSVSTSTRWIKNLARSTQGKNLTRTLISDHLPLNPDRSLIPSIPKVRITPVPQEVYDSHREHFSKPAVPVGPDIKRGARRRGANKDFIRQLRAVLRIVIPRYV